MATITFQSKLLSLQNHNKITINIKQKQYNNRQLNLLMTNQTNSQGRTSKDR